MSSSSSIYFLIVLSLSCGITAAQATDEDIREQSENPSVSSVIERWHVDIVPILADHCVRCHGSAKKSAGLDLRTLASLIAGSDAGAVLAHEADEKGRMIAVLTDGEPPSMPPETPLDPEDRDRLVQWAEAVSNVDFEMLEKAVRDSSAQSHDAPAGAHPWLPSNILPRLAVDIAVQTRWDPSQVPASICDDATFVRRVYLDLCGRIPSQAEAEAFLATTDSRKRESLVDSLLATQEHANHLAEIFDAVLMERKPTEVLKQRLRHGWRDYLRRSFAENRPWNEVVREILLARPSNPSSTGSTWYLYERKNEHQEIAEAIARCFFGVQIQCAQCHDHPLAGEIKQKHYWGLVAFFNRGQNNDDFGTPMIAESAIGGFSLFTNLEGESLPNDLTFLGRGAVSEARPPEGEQEKDSAELYRDPSYEGPRIPRFSRREKFVEHVLQGHPLVARAMVNRLWALCMGRGIVHPMDALDSAHPPSHPHLLDWLSQNFESHGYDVRRTLKELVLSRTYQLESNSEQFHDPAKFEVAKPKALTAEVLFRSMHVALDIPIQDESELIQRMDALREAFPDVMAEADIGNLRQALLLSNGDDIHHWISSEVSPWVRELISATSDEAIVDAAFGRVFGRSPDSEEKGRAVQFLANRKQRREDGVRQLIWALISSAEFRFNH